MTDTQRSPRGADDTTDEIDAAIRACAEWLDGKRAIMHHSQLRLVLASLREARERIAELSTPDIIGLDDCTYYAQDDFDGVCETPNLAHELDWANHTLGTWYAVKVVTEWDDEGDIAEMEVMLFKSKNEAEAVIAESEALRPVLPAPETGTDSISGAPRP